MLTTFRVHSALNNEVTNTRLQVALKMMPCWFFFLLCVTLFMRKGTVNPSGLLVTVVAAGLALLPASKLLLAILFSLCSVASQWSS